MRRMQSIIVGCFLSFNAFSSSNFTTIINETESLDNRWSIIASLGYSEYQYSYRSDGRTALGRLAFAAEVITTPQASFGLELGLQSGNVVKA